MTWNPLRWWRRRSARREAARQACYRASVDCLATLMRQDARRQRETVDAVVRRYPRDRRTTETVH